MKYKKQAKFAEPFDAYPIPVDVGKDAALIFKIDHDKKAVQWYGKHMRVTFKGLKRKDLQDTYFKHCFETGNGVVIWEDEIETWGDYRLTAQHLGELHAEGWDVMHSSWCACRKDSSNKPIEDQTCADQQCSECRHAGPFKPWEFETIRMTELRAKIGEVIGLHCSSF